MLKMTLLDSESMKNVALLLEDGEFDSSKVPTPRNLPSKGKKMLMPGVGWFLGTAGIG